MATSENDEKNVLQSRGRPRVPVDYPVSFTGDDGSGHGTVTNLTLAGGEMDFQTLLPDDDGAGRCQHAQRQHLAARGEALVRFEPSLGACWPLLLKAEARAKALPPVAAEPGRYLLADAMGFAYGLFDGVGDIFRKATEDPALRKLLPALYHRDLEGQLPDDFRIVAVSSAPRCAVVEQLAYIQSMPFSPTKRMRD